MTSTAKRLAFVVLVALSAVSGFAGAKALASGSETPPPRWCTNVTGWEVRIEGLNCLTAEKIVRRLTRSVAPKTSVRIANMTCTLGPAGRRVSSIRCAAGLRKSLRADLKLQGAAKRRLPAEKRCLPDFTDHKGRRWMVEVERYDCATAKLALSELLRKPPSERRRWDPDNLDCGSYGSRIVHCSYWSGPRAHGGFWAYLKLVPQPGTTAGTTTIEP